MRLERSIGPIGLTFVALSGMLGSGWLFVPMLVGQQAGPAGLVSWLIGGVIILFLALCYAEIGAMLPVAGGLARIPWFSHGNVVSAGMGWPAWVGYVSAAPIETLVMLKYLGPQMPFIFADGAQGGNAYGLGAAGSGVAFAVLVVMVLINAVGVRFFATVNTSLTWFKLGAPLIVSFALILSHFDIDNFTSHGFAPYGGHGAFSAVASGGIVFAFLGFRHAIDMAGETRNPQRTVPLALIGSILLCLLIYGSIQVAFVGGLSASDLAKGWAGVDFRHNFGPFEALALVVGLPWLMAVIYGSAVIAPFGGGLVATGSNARLAMALSKNGFFPRFVARLSRRGVPLNGLILNLVAGVLLLVFVEFETMVGLNTSAIVLSFAMGPIALYALRLQIPDQPRHFRLPRAREVACLAFIMAGWVLYWSGWNTLRLLGVALIVGLVLFVIMRALADRASRPPLDLREAIWLGPYVLVMGLISYLGDFGGGLKIIEWGWGVWVISAVSIGFFAWALRLRLPDDRAQANVRAD